ncbi:MAG: stage III sporulation protein AA [Lachnospiraceae bacterium]|nr:stage III sporulation protein AA [Lachnospiraceae bacterium]
MKEMEQITGIFPQKLRQLLKNAGTEAYQAEELRLRAGQPFLMKADGGEWYLRADGSGWGKVEEGLDAPYISQTEDIRDSLEYMSRYSLYAFDEELRQGYLTIPGGHRIGLAGQAVLEGNALKTLRNISFLNVRVARQVKGCADGVMPWIYQEGRICSVLVISPPGCGKTTLLRDMIRQASDGWNGKDMGWNPWPWSWQKEAGAYFVPGVTVGVADERSELGACCQGRPQNDLGFRTDVLDGCPKAEGIMMLIRSMAPQVVAVDEIGGRDDLEVIRYGKNCGCRLLATVHGCSLEDIRKKPVLKEFVEEGVFERYVVLKSHGKPGQIAQILAGDGNVLCGENGGKGAR